MSVQSDLNQEHDGPHEGPIRTPKQLMWAVIFAFLIPIVGIGLLVTYVATGQKSGAGSNALSEEAVALRIQPVGHVELRDASGPAVVRTGEEAFKVQCAACHTSGAAGAPKVGDAGAWGARISQGFETLLASALKGKGAMPPQAGGALSDHEVARAVVYMANNSGGKLAEPAAPAGAPAPAAPSQAAPPSPPPTQPAAAAAQPAATAPAAPAATANAGEALYKQACAACHTAGVAGAPKLGDKAGWAPRLGQGLDGLSASAIKGKGAMPPRGASTASDAEIRAAVEYMIGTVK
ncbi:c-type cytochrome [Caldimonas tepidiphila]|uniref:c-type cytochrome n=1 Tax=Caldimonas tepidiphila TaxID=2315841 RepID=UPI000E5BE1FB|nr:c-type cytochrome [Caldimonas tepidiphila]